NDRRRSPRLAIEARRPDLHVRRALVLAAEPRGEESARRGLDNGGGMTGSERCFLEDEHQTLHRLAATRQRRASATRPPAASRLTALADRRNPLPRADAHRGQS